MTTSKPVKATTGTKGAEEDVEDDPGAEADTEEEEEEEKETVDGAVEGHDAVDTDASTAQGKVKGKKGTAKPNALMVRLKAAATGNKGREAEVDADAEGDAQADAEANSDLAFENTPAFPHKAVGGRVPAQAASKLKPTAKPLLAKAKVSAASTASASAKGPTVKSGKVVLASVLPAGKAPKAAASKKRKADEEEED
jgi:hypothetical protein